MNPTLKKHLDAINSGAVTKTNIIGLRKAFNANARLTRGYGAGCTSPKVTPGDIGDLRRAITLIEPFVRGELHDSGLKVLQDPRYRKRFNLAQSRVVERVTVFKFVGLHQIDDCHATPIYKAVSPFGSVNFYVIPWQSALAYGLQSGPQIIGDYF